MKEDSFQSTIDTIETITLWLHASLEAIREGFKEELPSLNDEEKAEYLRVLRSYRIVTSHLETILDNCFSEEFFSLLEANGMYYYSEECEHEAREGYEEEQEVEGSEEEDSS